MSGTENLGRWLLDGAHDPEAVAIVAGGVRTTRAQLAARAAAVAGFLRAHLGLPRPTDAPRPWVVVAGESSSDLVAAYLGTLSSGAATVLVSLDKRVLAEAVRQTGAEIVLAPANMAPLAASSSCRVVSFPEAFAHAPDAGARCPSDETALVLFTSGSTATPKGVELSAANVIASTEALLRALPLSAADRTLAVLPFHYCYGLSVLHTHLRAAATLVLCASDYPAAIVECLRAERITGLPGVPSMFEILLRRSSIFDEPLPELRWLMTSGGRIAPETVQALRRGMPHTSIHLRYGTTEATSAVSCLEPEQIDRKECSIGRGLPGLPLRVERPDGSLLLPGSDEIGEIVVTGEHVTRGYLGDPEGTARVFVNGTFRTGDLARLDSEGYATIVGRARELIKTAGHRIAPQEVEEVLAQLEGVEQVVVYGIPHAIRGEAVAATLVVRGKLTMLDVQRFCAERLAPHKVPIEVRIASELPRGANGKVLRGHLVGLGDPLS